MVAAGILVRKTVHALLVIVIRALGGGLEDFLDASEPLRVALVMEGALSVLGCCEDISHIVTIVMHDRDLEEG